MSGGPPRSAACSRTPRAASLIAAVATVAVGASLAVLVAQDSRGAGAPAGSPSADSSSHNGARSRAAAVATAAIVDADDQAGPLDIAEATVTTTGDGMLRHLVRTYEPWSPADIRPPKTGPPPAICFQLWTTRTPGEDRPDFLLCASATADGRRLRGSLARIPATGRPRRWVVAEVDRPDDRSAALEIWPRQLGRPSSYRFTAEAQVVGAGCPGGVCSDFAPARGAGARFKP